MRIGILVTSIGNFGKQGYYNAQEIGLAKELAKFFEKVVIYKAVSLSEEQKKLSIDNFKNLVLLQIPVKNYGTNGWWDCDIMDPTLDALVYFSDTQVSVPKIYKWCYKNKVDLYPYIGVIESHSTNIFKKILINLLLKRNISLYKKCICFSKTPNLCDKLGELDIKKTVLAPVGLDVSLLFLDYKKRNVSILKKKYGYSDDDKIILFVGRLISEKQPIKMIELFFLIRQQNPEYKLLIIGKGELNKQVLDKIKENNLENYVCIIDRIPNKNMWEIYRIADCFVNLNQQEIFGMSILEAMFYECKVIAWRAPGPNYIIEHGVSGWLANSDQDIVRYIINQKDLSSAAHSRIASNFMWNNTAKIITEVIREG